jgi:hypothetical protein
MVLITAVFTNGALWKKCVVLVISKISITNATNKITEITIIIGRLIPLDLDDLLLLGITVDPANFYLYSNINILP